MYQIGNLGLGNGYSQFKLSFDEKKLLPNGQF